MPAFISKSARGDDFKEDIKSQQKNKEKSKKSFSIQSNKSKGYNSLVSSKIGSMDVNMFGTIKKDDFLYRTLKPQNPQKL